jgi:4,5-dihydroxyphthalate decarboxylase
MKRQLYEKHPWLALNIYHAFVEAKRQADLDAQEALQSMMETGVIGLNPGLKAMDWQDQAKKYGMKNSSAVLKTIAAYIFEQGLSQLPIEIEDIFAASTLEL